MEFFFFFFVGHMTGFSKAIRFKKKKEPFPIQSLGAVIQLQTWAAMWFQMLHVQMTSMCFNAVTALLAPDALVCVRGTALPVPRGCLC